MLIIFVLPPPLGVASDGSLSQTMSDSGLRYLEEDLNHQENDYFVQQYERVVPTYENMNIHILTVKLAEKLDDWITSNSIFDLRFLAFIYAIFYMPALWLLIKSATERVAFFSERAVVTILGILIFSDISYLTFFNSLYSEALIFLCILYCAAFGMSLQKEKKTNYADRLFNHIAVLIHKQSFGNRSNLIQIDVPQILGWQNVWIIRLCRRNNLFCGFHRLFRIDIRRNSHNLYP